MKELKWNIGKEDGGRTRLDKPPYRAYFWWIEDGRIVECADFSRAELSKEISRRRLAGEETAVFEEALKRLDE